MWTIIFLVGSFVINKQKFWSIGNVVYNGPATASNATENQAKEIIKGTKLGSYVLTMTRRAEILLGIGLLYIFPPFKIKIKIKISTYW
jgi:hypothetical protein